ncbi:Glycosyltransferase LafB, responsible for the formation of Gal-Glc-DAG [Streptococcus mitis]|uniref:Glycosyltransferase LafB, responsible for the formation of Gal-Glc-DAG n=2 Tax=Streptococcus mitis TaxID=28037 RepID=A0A139Q9H4_STRMT|nr:Glycosyltransferase LafB, responsible for the formation of Gal-Glc-DAG [Streptococcus mitis]
MEERGNFPLFSSSLSFLLLILFQENDIIVVMEKKKLRINMLSSSEKVAGQGVSGAYRELVRLLHRDAKDQLIVTENLPIEADVTHFHTIDFPYYLSTFQKKRSGRKIGYVHFLPDTLEGSLKIPFFLKGIVKRYVFSFYNRMEHLVVVNPMFIEDLVVAGIPREKVTYIPNFVNKEKWHPLPQEEVARLRTELGLSDNQFIVVGAGQVQKRKGIDDFIRLAEELPQITFIWAGGFSFGGMTDGYERYKKMMENPPKNLIFPGIVSPERMRELYALANLFLLPSYNELFPMTILEAASCEAPIMLRDLDLYKVILEGNYRATADREEMKEAILEYQANPVALKDLKEKAKNISREYSEEHLLQIWLDFYEKQAALGRK